MAARGAQPSYVELHAASAFSFLRGSSLPEDLIERAAAMELPAAALVDVDGVYGAPRFYQAAKQAGVRALVGAEVTLDEADPPAAGRRGPLGLVAPPTDRERGDEVSTGPRVTVL